MPTVARILEITPPSCYLASNRTAKGALFGPPIDPKLPLTIYMVYKILKVVYDKDPNYTGVRVVADYLYELIQKYAFKAAAIVDGNTGGQVAPPSGIVVPNPYDFEVDGTSFIPTGDDSVTISQFIGYNVNFSRGGIMQNTTNLGDGSSYYSWNIVTGLFTIFPAATEGELFRIMPDVYGNGGTTTIIDNTTFPLVITNADMTGGVTYDNAAIVGSQYMLFVSGYNSEWQFAGVFFDYTATGFTIIEPGFDAANFGNIIIQKIN
jgi:hypothetical protein